MKILSVVALLSIAGVAAAEPETLTLRRTCAEVAPDNLDDAGRIAAQRRLVAALEQTELFVVDADCEDTYRVEHLRIDNVAAVRMIDPHGRARRWTNPVGDELAVYKAMIDAFLHEPVAATAPPPTVVQVSPPSPPAMENPVPLPPPMLTSRSIPSYRIWYAALGGASGLGGAGTVVTLGLRHHAASAGVIIDARLRSVSAGSWTAADAGMNVLARSGTFYFGGGGAFSRAGDVAGQQGSGLALLGVAGIDLGGSQLRPFLQAELSLPLYTARDALMTRSEYPATLGVSLGLGR